MRTLDWGQKLPKTGSLFATVKKKGDSITFRIAQPPVYTGKHFVQDGEKWNVLDCPRINNPEAQEECELCTKYFEIFNMAREAREKGDKASAEELKEQARPHNVSIRFYFPILNRDTKKFQVLRTTLGVRNKLDEEFNSGVKIMGVDWVLRNTGSDSPRDLYSLIRKDSADTKVLDKEEKVEYEKAKSYDMSKVSDRVSSKTYDSEADDSLVETAKEIFDEK